MQASPYASPQVDLSRPREELRTSRYTVLGFACLLAVVSYLMRNCPGQLAVDIRHTLNLSAFDWGIVLAGFYVAYGVFEIPGGYFADRFGPRNTLIVAVLGFSLMTALAGLAGGLATLLVLRFIFGAFQATVFPAISRMLAAWMPLSQRAAALGILWMSARLGAAAGQPAINWVSQTFGSWRLSLLALSTLGVVWCLAFVPFYRERHNAEAGEVPTPTGKARSHFDVPWRRIFTSANVWKLCLMYGCAGLTANFIQFGPQYLEETLHATPRESAWLTGAAWASAALGSLLSGMVSDAVIRRTGGIKWGRRALGAAGFLLAAIFIWMFSLATTPLAAGVILCGSTFAFDLVMPVAWATCTDIGKAYSGTISGMMNTLGSVGAVISMLFTGQAVDHHLVPALCVVFGLIYLFGALLWLGIDATKPVEPDTEAATLPLTQPAAA